MSARGAVQAFDTGCNGLVHEGVFLLECCFSVIGDVAAPFLCKQWYFEFVATFAHRGGGVYVSLVFPCKWKSVGKNKNKTRKHTNKRKERERERKKERESSFSLC